VREFKICMLETGRYRDWPVAVSDVGATRRLTLLNSFLTEFLNAFHSTPFTCSSTFKSPQSDRVAICPVGPVSVEE